MFYNFLPIIKNMKKGFSVLLALFFLFPVFSIDLPEPLLGIWEGKDRFVFFEQQPENENPELVIILKEYYGWYFDRAAEPQAYAAREARTRNAATHKTAEYIPYKINDFTSDEDSCSFEILTTYSKHEKNYIPAAIIQGRLFIDFYKKLPDYATRDDDGNLIISQNGYWIGNIDTKGFTLDSQAIDTNIGLMIVDGEKMYDIRYWLSDVEMRNEADKSVLFEYEDDKYTVPKYLFYANNQYTNVHGRRKKIRNTQGAFNFEASDYYFNENKTLMAKKDKEYLIKIVDKNDFEALMNIVKVANSRRKPDPPPLFPPKELDWHWDLIDYLEKDNALVKQVRERQRAFGLRGKELNPPR